MQAIGHTPAARVVLAPEGEHHLRHRHASGTGLRQRPQRRQPPLGHRVVEPVDHALDDELSGLERAFRQTRQQHLLDGLLVVSLCQQ